MASPPAMMRAVVLDAPGPPESLRIRELRIPAPTKGEVLIKVEAFGLNRSELHTRLGLADDVTFPRVLGIEATGTVIECPGAELATGSQVMTMMGGMGRTFDGGYAQYVKVPVGQVLPFTSPLPWEVLGAVPEMLQTAYGSLTVGLDMQPGQWLLVRGGTSSVGMTAAILAKQHGLQVIATTRSTRKVADLTAIGVDEVVIDDGDIADQVRSVVAGGVDIALELIGTPTLRDTLAATRTHGTVCFTGMLSNEWIVHDFYPIDYLPPGVRLTSYAGGAPDLPVEVLQRFLDDVAAGRCRVPVARTYRLDDIQQAHRDMETNAVAGKLVVIP
jgi:NADPH2:quinone reductase